MPSAAKALGCRTHFFRYGYIGTKQTIKVTTIVDIIAHCMRPMCCSFVNLGTRVRPVRWQHAVHSLSTRHSFHNPDSNCVFLFFHVCTVRYAYVTGEN